MERKAAGRKEAKGAGVKGAGTMGDTSFEIVWKCQGQQPTQLKPYMVRVSHFRVLTRKITSFNVDQIHSEDIDVQPEYQREVVWPETKQVKLIDSVFRNFYIPPIIFGKHPPSILINFTLTDELFEQLYRRTKTVLKNEFVSTASNAWQVYNGLWMGSYRTKTRTSLHYL
jgi:hypothetical protein